MTSTLAGYSPVQRDAVYQCIRVEVDAEARRETEAAPSSSLRIQRLFRLGYHLIDAYVDFNQRHAAASLAKAASFPGMSVPDPWGESVYDELVTRVVELSRRLAQLAVDRWGVPENQARFFASVAIDELRQRICEEFEAGRDAYWSAMKRQTEATPIASGVPQGGRASASKRRRDTRKREVEAGLRKLEAHARKKATQEGWPESRLTEVLIPDLYSLSAQKLVPRLKKLGCEVSGKTVQRSDKYHSWAQYRRPSTPPCEHVDTGPANSSPADEAAGSADAGSEVGSEHSGGRDVVLDTGLRPRPADSARIAAADGHLSLRKGGRGNPRIRKTANERANEAEADEFARRHGATLPPAE